jgi:hypothetical protein
MPPEDQIRGIYGPLSSGLIGSVDLNRGPGLGGTREGSGARIGEGSVARPQTVNFYEDYDKRMKAGLASMERGVQLQNASADEAIAERRGLGTRIEPGSTYNFSAEGDLLSRVPDAGLAQPSVDDPRKSRLPIYGMSGGVMTADYGDSRSPEQKAATSATTISNMAGNPFGAAYDTQSYNNMPNTLNPRESRGLSTPAVVAEPGARDVELLRRLDAAGSPPVDKPAMGASRSYAEPTSGLLMSGLGLPDKTEDMFYTAGSSVGRGLMGLKNVAGDIVKSAGGQIAAQATSPNYVNPAGKLFREPAAEAFPFPRMKKAGQSFGEGYRYGLGQ